MDATISIHLASIYSSRIAGHRLRTSQCLRIPAASELVHPGYRVGDALWTDIHVNASGAETDLHLRLLTTPQHLGGERRWFACASRIPNSLAESLVCTLVVRNTPTRGAVPQSPC